jgi:hypothetical protein
MDTLDHCARPRPLRLLIAIEQLGRGAALAVWRHPQLELAEPGDEGTGSDSGRNSTRRSGVRSLVSNHQSATTALAS